MFDIQAIRDLPDSMPASELALQFREVLRDSPHARVDEVLEALAELADRQWHSYARIEPELGANVVAQLIALWNPNDSERVRGVASILATLAPVADVSGGRALLARTLRCSSGETREYLAKALSIIDNPPQFGG